MEREREAKIRRCDERDSLTSRKLDRWVDRDSVGRGSEGGRRRGGPRGRGRGVGLVFHLNLLRTATIFSVPGRLIVKSSQECTL